MNSVFHAFIFLIFAAWLSHAQASRLASESMKDEFCKTDSPKVTDMSGSRCEDEFEIARDVCHFGTRKAAPSRFKERYCRLHEIVQEIKTKAGYGEVGSIAANQIIANLADAGPLKADLLNDMARAVYKREHYHAAACESAVSNCISMCGGMSEAIVNKCMRLERDAKKLAAAAEQAGELGGLRANTIVATPAKDEELEKKPEKLKPLPKTPPKKKRIPAKKVEDDWDAELDEPVDEPMQKAPVKPMKKTKPVKKSKKPKEPQDEMDLLLDNIESEMGFD